jgi:branched-chain amino acid transport system ATP-binding protein
MLEVDQIDVFYGDLQALWDISVSVPKGEITALVGSNGAGKSTLLKTICGLLKPARGSIRFNNVQLDKTPAHEIVRLGISVVHEGRRLFPQMSVLENLEMGAFNPNARKKSSEMTTWVFETFPGQPELLLMDEVSLGLAPIVVRHIYNVVKGINESKRIAIFLVEQNVQLALEVAESGYILETGSIVEHEKAYLLLRSDKVRESYLGFK